MNNIRVKLIHRNYKSELVERPKDEPVIKYIGHNGKLFMYDGVGYGMVHQYREVSKRVANRMKL